MTRPLTISAAMQAYLDLKANVKSRATAKAYGQALRLFRRAIEEHGLDLESPPGELPVDAFAWFTEQLNREVSASSERLYASAVAGFYQYLVAEELAEPNLARLELLRKNRVRPAPKRLPQFPKEDIEKVIAYAARLVEKPAVDREERLRNLRDRALILILADTGLRIHEACKLRRGDVDPNEGRAVLIGKGDKQAVVRFSTRSLAALKDYLNARQELDRISNKPMRSLPLFLRHDPAASTPDRQFRQITTETGRHIVADRVQEALGPQAAGSITPHSFRHYFVTVILNSTGNLKTAQALARHSNITTTSLYAHLIDTELDQAYWQTFDQAREEGQRRPDLDQD